MKQIIDSIWHVGDSGCAVYLVDTQSSAGIVLSTSPFRVSMVSRMPNP